MVVYVPSPPVPLPNPVMNVFAGAPVPVTTSPIEIKPVLAETVSVVPEPSPVKLAPIEAVMLPPIEAVMVAGLIACSCATDMDAKLAPRRNAATGDVLYCEKYSVPGVSSALRNPLK